jgi:hypothetical protein
MVRVVVGMKCWPVNANGENAFETECANQMTEQMEILRAMLDRETSARSGHEEGGQSLPYQPG